MDINSESLNGLVGIGIGILIAAIVLVIFYYITYIRALICACKIRKMAKECDSSGIGFAITAIVFLSVPLLSPVVGIFSGRMGTVLCNTYSICGLVFLCISGHEVKNDQIAQNKYDEENDIMKKAVSCTVLCCIYYVLCIAVAIVSAYIFKAQYGSFLTQYGPAIGSFLSQHGTKVGLALLRRMF